MPYDLVCLSMSFSQHTTTSISILILDPSCFVDVVGIIYCCQLALVVKFSFSSETAQKQLHNEARVHKHFPSSGIQSKCLCFMVFSKLGPSWQSFFSMKAIHYPHLKVYCRIRGKLFIIHGGALIL